MNAKTKGFWQTLEKIPGLTAVEAEWKARFGPDYKYGMKFLRPNGKLALSYPCMIPDGCGCYHDVINHSADDIVAVCKCGRECETFPLQRQDIIVYELNHHVLESALVNVFGLFKETETRTEIRGTTCIGVYSPYAGFRFPVYLTIQIEPDDFTDIIESLIGRSEIAFILLAPTRELCTVKTEKRITDKKSIFVPLSESVTIDDKRELKFLRSIEEILTPFCTANLPLTKEDCSRVFFPTPSDATWGDVTIRFKDGYTVLIKAKSVSGVFNYTQMGMADNRNTNPTVQWELLHAFADGYGTLDWTSSQADRRNQKRREKLAADLRAFFRIEGDPFRLTEDGKGWQARLHISPDE